MRCTTCKYDHDGPSKTCESCLSVRRNKRTLQRALDLCGAVGCANKYLPNQKKCKYHAIYFRDKSRESRLRKNGGEVSARCKDPLQNYDSVL